MPDATDIQAFLGDSRWKNRFDDEILAAAQGLVSKARELRIDATAAGTLTLLGAVANEDAEVSVWQSGGGWDFETACSCEIGSYCHHAAALLLKAEKQRDP